MNNLAKMKAELVELDTQKKKLKTEIEISRKRFKLCLWVVGGGVALLPLYGTGVFMIIAGGVMALIVNERQNRLQDRLAEVDAQIIKLEISMA
jgi:hypothetical protein